MDTLTKSFVNANSQTDWAVEIADTDDNLSVMRGFSGTTKAQYTTELEAKSFVAITSGTPLEGEYRVIDRTKIGGHS